MNLKPQDILVLLKLLVLGDKPWTFNQLALELAMSPAEVHGASKRLLAAKLATQLNGKLKPHFRNLEEFLFHGIQYVFVPQAGSVTRGMPTSVAAPVMREHFQQEDLLPPVWPDAEGTVRGESFSPLYASVPIAAKNDEILYELLALVDALRGGRAREREFAKKALKRRFETYGENT
jgi:hypothetical protein